VGAEVDPTDAPWLFALVCRGDVRGPRATADPLRSICSMAISSGGRDA
jgi:hypothetical protein